MTCFAHLVRVAYVSWGQVLLPRLRAFAPELLMISAGFDGLFEDIKGNNGFSHLVEDDYEWITQKLCEVRPKTDTSKPPTYKLPNPKVWDKEK